MKTSSPLFVVAALVLLTTSCAQRNIRMQTDIYRNGTCARQLTFHADSATLLSPPDSGIRVGHVSIGEGWTCTWSLGDTASHSLPMSAADYRAIQAELRRQGIDKRVADTVTVTARRVFRSVGEMGDALPLVLGDAPLRSTCTLQKRFRWFYTDYTFTETFPCIDTLFSVPLTDFVSADMASYWFTGQPQLFPGRSGAEVKAQLDKTEELIGQWLNVNLMATVYDLLAAHYAEVQRPPVSFGQFVALRDSVLGMARERDLVDFDGTGAVSQLLSDVFHSDAYAPLLANGTALTAELNQKYDAYVALTSLFVDYWLAMPGRLLSADTPALSTVVSGERLIPHDYTILATSRCTHPWAFVVTALLLLLSVASFYYKRRK